mgnify:CR=1 FL=1
MGAVFGQSGNILSIKLDGELDHHSADVVKEKADMLIDQKDMRHIIFDFKHINFMDSSGIGFVMGRYRKVQEKGGQAVIVGANAYVDRIFQMSGIYQIIGKCRDMDEAVGLIEGER